jgi:hypothetical protein
LGCEISQSSRPEKERRRTVQQLLPAPQYVYLIHLEHEITTNYCQGAGTATTKEAKAAKKVRRVALK